MTDKGKVIKIIAQHVLEYNELNEKYMNALSDYRDLTTRFVDLNMLYKNAKKENRSLKKLLDTSEQMLEVLREGEQ